MDMDLLGVFQSLDETPFEREGIELSPFQYPGSKNRSLKHLMNYLPYGDSWIEGFGGTGAVTLARRLSKFEVFNERHAGITAFYRCLVDRQKKDQLVDRLDLTIHSREMYDWSRDTWECNWLDDVERAARWYYSVRYSFAGMGRNFGRAKSSNGLMAGRIRDSLDLFETIHDRFKYVQVENLDWRHVLKDFDGDGTVFYLDPPYYGKNIYKHNMTHADHIEMCVKIFNCRGFVALSGYANPIYDEFPWDRKESWYVHVTATTKAVNTDTSNVTKVGIDQAEEFLWMKEFS